ncbi:MAG: hypothetical protein HY657_12545 [Acidobacteria bacterium]|nr:hypothetical protein [Acidobacteriota bacterium]
MSGLRRRHRSVLTLLSGALALAGLAVADTAAQQGPAAPTRSGREGALIDITGQWVSIVNEDWRWRMVTPPKGDAASVPLNPAGRRVTNAWDLAADRARGELCKAFGPPGLIRQPGRLRISWESDNTLALDFDAGMQTRRFHFGEPPPRGAPSLQGHSEARWVRQQQTRGFFGLVGAARRGGSLEVVTTNLRAGYLRPNGEPYSDRATVTEFFDTFALPDDDGTWLIVTTVVDDPAYLSQEFVISSQFKKESDPSKWSLRPCEIPPPLR